MDSWQRHRYRLPSHQADADVNLATGYLEIIDLQFLVSLSFLRFRRRGRLVGSAGSRLQVGDDRAEVVFLEIGLVGDFGPVDQDRANDDFISEQLARLDGQARAPDLDSRRRLVFGRVADHQTFERTGAGKERKTD